MKPSPGLKLLPFLFPWWMVAPSPARDAAADPDFTVRFYDYAGIDRATADAMASGVLRIFDGAGIRTEWLNCRVSWPQISGTETCESAPGERVYVVRLLASAGARNRSVNGMPLGSASLAPAGGRYADVYLENIEEAVRQHYGWSRGQVMAHTVAHELGHLVLGADAHATTGIMRRRWTRDEFESMKKHCLGFTKWEQGLLRQKLQVRPAEQP